MTSVVFKNIEPKLQQFNARNFHRGTAVNTLECSARDGIEKVLSTLA